MPDDQKRASKPKPMKDGHDPRPPKQAVREPQNEETPGPPFENDANRLGNKR